MKRIISAVMCVLLLLTVTACSKSGSGKDGSNDIGSAAASMNESVASMVGSSDIGDNSQSTVTTPENTQSDVTSVTSSEQNVSSEPISSTVSTAKPVIPTVSEPDTSSTTKPSKPQTTSSQVSSSSSTDQPSTPTASTPSAPTYSYTTGQSHTKIAYTERYVYVTLNAEQKKCYKALNDAVCALEPTAEVDTSLEMKDMSYVYKAYVMDNPEHFYLGNSIKLSGMSNSTVKTYLISYSDGSVTSPNGELSDSLKASIKAKKSAFDAKVQSIVSTIPSNATEVWKEKLIYDRILIDCKYNTNAAEGGMNDTNFYNWTAYGAIMDKTGVCEAYSEAFQLLCLYVGINNVGVSGTAEGGGHKWNCVKIGGEWYTCDITFDDPVNGKDGATRHDYFNLTSAEMKLKNSHRESGELPVPNCTATKYSFKNAF